MKSSYGERDKFHNHDTKSLEKRRRFYVTKADDIHHIYYLLGRSSDVLIGPDTADSLFGRHDGITGETVRIDALRCE